ncbi:hypothetical protein [Rhodanobacter sp. MP1X3]|uniref:hypothetical protein n=1 Tax=Rhodanobacter sp. MP1X3 TaxID=2723086 RepID=UPI00160EB87C|nr:hypothetical protein [Rhodanobacter sp. MP1X3]MBB6242432.1 hypothetical protein [Rhodanobacter sp. MP1X3]
MRSTWLTTLLIVSCFATNTDHANERSINLKDVIVKASNVSAIPRPEDIATALRITIGKPSLNDGGVDIGEFANYVYPVGKNPWGITSIRRSFHLDDSGLREATNDTVLSLDQTYCVKPADFPKTMNLKLFKILEPFPDGGGATEHDFYMGTIEETGKFLSIDSAGEQGCAKSISLAYRYRELGVAAAQAKSLWASTGPFVASSPSTNDLATPFKVHPPFSADDFLKKVMLLIQAHRGYITSDELNNAFDLKIAPVHAVGNRVASYHLQEHKDWYIGLAYALSGPDYRSNQKGIYPDGQGSTVDFSFHSYTFLSPSANPMCLAAEVVEAGLLKNGWSEVPQEKPNAARLPYVNPIESILFKMPNSVSSVKVFAKTYLSQSCVLGLRIIGAANSAG